VIWINIPLNAEMKPQGRAMNREIADVLEVPISQNILDGLLLLFPVMTRVQLIGQR